MFQWDELVVLAERTSEESDVLDFKREFLPENKAAFWAETVKDIVAMANTKGGIIVFGVCDDGALSDGNFVELFGFDNAAITDQVRKYTGENISGIEVVSVNRNGFDFPALVVPRLDVPLVFTRVGTYEIAEGSQKNAFSVGTVYFRHGSKSEPAARADLAACIERRLAAIREEWLGNIRKVVEAEPGTTVILTQSVPTTGDFRITSDPKAPAVRLPNLGSRPIDLAPSA